MIQLGGAMGLLNSPSASAEIEGEESEMVCVDAPVAPERDLIAMLKQTKAIPHDIHNLVLKAYFIAAEEEKTTVVESNCALNTDHIRDLLQKYQGEEESKCGIEFEEEKIPKFQQNFAIVLFTR